MSHAHLNSAYAVVTSDRHGTILSVNQNSTKLFGYMAEEMVGQKVNMLMAPPYNMQHDTYMERYFRTNEARVIGKSREVVALHKTGKLLHLNLSLSQAETVRGTMFLALFERSEDHNIIFDVDVKGVIHRVKGDTFLTFGYHANEMVGKNISVICPPGIAAKHDMYMQKYQETGETKVLNRVRNLQAAHKFKPDLINIALHVVPSKIIVTAKDGTQTEVEGYRGVITPVDGVEAMLQVNLHGKIVSASTEFLLLFGYTENEVLGKSIAILVKGDLKEITNMRTFTGTITRNVVGLHKDGSVFTAKIMVEHATALVDPSPETEQDTVGYVVKILRAGKKKEDRDMIEEGDYMGHYSYGKTLGSGYFGKVRMAVHRLTGEKVAIKTLRKKQYEAVKMEYPPREVTVLKALSHPHVNQLLDTVVLDDRIYLILEYVEGRELCEVVESSTIPEHIARHIFRQILLAVEYMHSQGIVHRDLKLENVIIDKAGNAKVIDMGFGNFFIGKNHLLRTFCGSPDYAAPELFLGKAYRGPLADIWSLGVMLFAMLSGLLPFKDSQCVMSCSYFFPSSISSTARDLISRVFQLDPEARCSLEDIMSHPWVCHGYDGPPVQPKSALDSPMDIAILDEMEGFGMDSATVQGSLQRREFNQFTTTYILLWKKKQRERSLIESQSPASTTTSSAPGAAPVVVPPAGKATTGDKVAQEIAKHGRKKDPKEECVIL